MSRLLRLAAVQLPRYVAGASGPASTAANVAAALPLVRAAASGPNRPDLILLPEAFPQGYSYDARRVWRAVDRGLPEAPTGAPVVVDPKRAPAAAALCAMAAEVGTHLASTILEYYAPTGDVLNTFVVARPDGRLHWELSSKRHPAHFERFVFAAGTGIPHRSGRVLTLDLGGHTGSVRLGVSICNDNYQRDCVTELAAAQPDVVAMPHCCMVPGETIGFPASATNHMFKTVRGAAGSMSRLLGVPAVSTNYVGPFPAEEKLPWLFAPMTSLQLRLPATRFPGMAAVMPPGGGGAGAGGGSAVQAAPEEPGWVAAEVALRASPPPAVATADIARETVPDVGGLGLPLLMDRTAPINEGAGKLWYNWNAAARTADCMLGGAKLA